MKDGSTSKHPDLKPEITYFQKIQKHFKTGRNKETYGLCPNVDMQSD